MPNRTRTSNMLNLNRIDIDLINNYLNTNKDVNTFRIIKENGSGIGYNLYLEYDHLQIIENNSFPATTKVELLGVDRW